MWKSIFTLCLLLGASLVAAEKQPSCQFVDVTAINPDIKLDIRYATVNNFLNTPAYKEAKCYLHYDVALALGQVQKAVEAMGLSLKVFDGYRPLHVQQKMWDLIQDEKYVSNPAKNKGRHTRGTAIDLTLVNAKGEELEMPTPFDDFTESAFSDAQDVTETARKNRQLLKTVMEKEGFVQYPYEWWHFDYTGWNDDEKYPPSNISFEEIASSTE